MSIMANPKLLYLLLFRSLLLIMIFVTKIQSENLECPSSCSCLGEFVDCSKQGFVKVPQDIPIWTENLELSHNAITSLVDEKLEHLTMLLQLDLSANQLRDNMTDSLRKLPSLAELKLNQNLLTELPTLNGMSHLTYLSLSHNGIHSLNCRAIEGLPKLKTLDLSSNRLYEITEHSFPNGSAIQILNLNNNRINSIEKGSLDLLGAHLLELKLNRNQLTKFSKEVFKQLKHVKVLELNRNSFMEIEGLSFLGLEGLNVLKLRRNSIHTLLDGAFWGLQNMTTLLLEHNNISTVTKGWLYGLTSLRHLTLNNNAVTSIEADGWEFCQQLVQLDLANNELAAIERLTFQHLSNLQRLSLNDNRIAFIADGAFNCTPHLEILELNGNHISWTIEDMTGAFFGLTRLSTFRLASNDIKSINRRAFLGLERLKHMDLSNNSVTSIQENAFAAMPLLEQLVVNTSSLLCDCKAVWLQEWLKTARSQDTIQALCAYPYWLKGKALAQVPLGNLTCDDFPIPHIVEDPKTQISLKGENVQLECRARSTTEASMTFIWKKDNLDLLGGHVEQFARSEPAEQWSLLTLQNVTHGDAGKYQCVVTNQFGTSYSSRAKISVLIFPTFAKTPGNVTVKSGNTARLECAARGQPPPRIAWQKDGGNDFPAARQRRMHIMPADDVFFIINVAPADTGVYSCTAQNQAGTIVANASLVVLEPPSFVKAMENKEITAGEPIVLECMASGSPKPVLSWTKDGGSLLTTERHFFTADDQLLIIVDTALSDGGIYECLMTNTLGTEKGSSQLTVVPASGSTASDSDMAGIILITVVCCAVGTSIIWVVIIYQTRKQSKAVGGKPLPPLPAYPHYTAPQLYSDNESEHSSSKDSGTGDSAKRSNDHLLLVTEVNVVEVSPTTELDHQRTDHERCQRWSAPHYLAQMQTHADSCSYHSLQDVQTTLSS